MDDFKRLLTYEKLKGTLHEVIYSMEAAQIKFYPYQFKPVLKFINSPTERLILADEVGLGKTIEAALIWIEVQARNQAKRLLVVCPKMLQRKWQDELRTKFMIDARISDFSELKREVKLLKKEGPAHSFALICSYSGLIAPRNELKLLKNPPEEGSICSPKTNFQRDLRHWDQGYDVFDMVLFDEAHYMRNASTSTFNLGLSLCDAANAVLCITATPVNNSNEDLRNLIKLVDEDFLETKNLFEELIIANRPTVQLCNELSRQPPDMEKVRKAAADMAHSNFIEESPLYTRLVKEIESLDPNDKQGIALCHDLGERLNLLGGYINRTRRVQVKENRPVRHAVVLTVKYKPEEMILYDTILEVVRRKCLQEDRPFHIFHMLGLQLRAASCLPVVAQDIVDGRFGEIEELTEEILEDELFATSDQLTFGDILDPKELEEVLDFDFEKNDSKYFIMLDMLRKTPPKEKIIIFSYYIPTLFYLKRRLGNDDVSVAIIHGSMSIDERLEEIARFRKPTGPRVLLSSEVGSEGIDLQFCKTLVNYDLPWNPMRVEQRIGRIDRIGQKSKKLTIVNFKVEDTVEERLYERLHEKLDRFRNSLGDLEAVIGNEVRKLQMQVLSQRLSPIQELKMMEQSEQVIETRLRQLQALEESGDTLIALSDYVQKQIEEDREKGRYVQPKELEDYLIDFFEREFHGCELNQNTPSTGCLRLKLNPVAQMSLSSYLQEDRSLLARPLRQKEINLTFDNEIKARLPATLQQKVHFANHLSPLIKWVTAINSQREHRFHNVSALLLEHPELNPGIYTYRIERWRMQGIASKEILAYAVQNIETGSTYLKAKAESIVRQLLETGRDWDHLDFDLDTLLSSQENLQSTMMESFSRAITEFDANNENMHRIRVRRVSAFFDRVIAANRKALETVTREVRKPHIIDLNQRKLDRSIENKENRISKLNQRATIECEQADVAAGVFLAVS
ncbi:hypothetical protein FAK_01990 [Desulfoferula mesophila]|uniref:Uncharacterized protein n=2 Tax=Desulfoferula mesophila TaxID=3058419 RepID=A0AAU9E7K9_9BACT|nr:hypothetical protein FAK_01990 [Desulfoferula mesophilus]